MYRVNAITKQMVKLQIVKDGKLHDVNLLPGMFLFTEELTAQIQNLEKNKVIRTHPVTITPVIPAAGKSVQKATTSTTFNTSSKITPVTSEVQAASSVEEDKSTETLNLKKKNSSAK